MAEYVVLDFETANPKRVSACEELDFLLRLHRREGTI